MSPIDSHQAPRHFRDVLGQFPTGVAIIAALDLDGLPCGMAVGSFSSVSLDPPLVAFMPSRTSSTYPVIAAAASFCVSILAADQEDVCRAMATKGVDKFSDVEWFPAPSGAPVIAGALAWIDCVPTQVHDAGDHLIVLGAVKDLAELRSGSPLVFFRGGYGGFATTSLIAVPEIDIVEPLRLAGRARPLMEELAHELDLECLAVAAVGDQSVSLAMAEGTSQGYTPSRVGYRTPLTFPVGSVFTAWDPTSAATWLPQASARAEIGEHSLNRVRERRWSIAIGDSHYDQLEREVGQLLIQGQRSNGSIEAVMDQLDERCFDIALEPGRSYDVRMLMAPIFGAEGVELALAIRGFRQHLEISEIERIADRLVAAADEVSRKIGGADQLANLAGSR